MSDSVPDDGVYFDLPAATYHASHALGSTDMLRLAANPVRWWYYSKRNPDRPEDHDTPALQFGRAVHMMILEGRDAFERHYAPAALPGNLKAGKDERAEIAASGREALPLAAYQRVLVAATYITADPELRPAFQGGRSEVSVFWTRDGIRRKARFDYLKLRSIVDLKSTRDQDELEFDVWCKREIAKRRMYVQLAHYFEAREQMGRFRMSAVHGLDATEWFARVVAEPNPYWTWIFYQSSGAPETFGTYTAHGSKLHQIGQSQIALAEHHYREFGDRFGFDGLPWVRVRALEAYNEDEQPEWVWR